MKIKKFLIKFLKYKTTKLTILLTIFLFLFFLIAPHTTALNITNTTGENFIEWYWNDSSLSTVYVDGIPYHYNWTFGYTIINDLNPNELHRIDIIIGEDSYYQETYTNELFYNTLYFRLLAAVIVCLILSLGIVAFALPAFIFSFALLWVMFTQYATNEYFPHIFAFGIILLVISGLRMSLKW